MHSIIENYYDPNKQVMVGLTEKELNIVKSAIKLLPLPHEKVYLERDLSFSYDEGVKYSQRTDLYDARERVPEIIDFKTMKDFRFALDERDLTQNIQVLSYANAVLGEVEAVRVSHLQIALEVVEPPRKVSIELSRDYVKEKWEQAEERFFKPMLKSRRLPIVDVEARVGKACEDYGGCWHKEHCELSRKGGDFMAVIRDKNEKKEEKKEVEIKKELNKISCLFVDCAPMKGSIQPVLFSDFIEEILTALCEKAGVEDWRLIEFGKGRGFVAIALRKVTLPEYMVINTKEDLSSTALEVLVGRSENVVWGSK